MILNLGIPASEYPEQEGTEAGMLAVLGSARCVWDDYAQLCGKATFDVMCVNDIIMHFPERIDHAYSNDDDMLHRWHVARRDQLRAKHPAIRGLHSLRTWPWPGHGTSALGAVYTGLALGYEEIVLCGVPLDGSGHYFDPPWVESNHDRENIAHWITARDKVFEGRVHSLSGRTQEVLDG